MHRTGVEIAVARVDTRIYGGKIEATIKSSLNHQVSELNTSTHAKTWFDRPKIDIYEFIRKIYEK